MRREPMIQALVDIIAEKRQHPRGIQGILEDGEQSAGRTIIPLGATEPFAFSPDDFAGGVISLDKGEARIVVIQAHREGTGALRRLVDGILSAGLRPVVVEPVGRTMPAILKRWQWQRRVIGRGFERFEEWRPQKEAVR